MEQEVLIGVITEDAWVEVPDGRKFPIDRRGTDADGNPQVLID